MAELEGAWEGEVEGMSLGIDDGDVVGGADGMLEIVGGMDGPKDGLVVGASVGVDEGDGDGAGLSVGTFEWASDGVADGPGFSVGKALGEGLGAGLSVGVDEGCVVGSGLGGLVGGRSTRVPVAAGSRANCFCAAPWPAASARRNAKRSAFIVVQLFLLSFVVKISFQELLCVKLQWMTGGWDVLFVTALVRKEPLLAAVGRRRGLLVDLSLRWREELIVRSIEN